MKIAISTDLYYPMINGVAVFSRNLATGLAQRGHQVLVLTPSTNGRPSLEDDPAGFRVARLTSHKFPLYPDQIHPLQHSKVFHKHGLRFSPRPGKRIRQLLDEFQPDIIHNQTPGPVALATFRYAKRHHIPIVSTGHAYPDNITGSIKPKTLKKPIDSVVRRYLASFLKKSAYATAPTTVAVHDLVPAKHRAKVRIEALSNGIDLSRFSPGQTPQAIHAKYHIPADRNIILYLGRLDPEKSLSVLIDAFAQAQAQFAQPAHLLIVGEGLDRHKLEQQARKLQLTDQITFTGGIFGAATADLPDIYRSAKLFAITSQTETESIVLMEAMASGLPAVAVRAGAIPELVHNGENGFLCSPRDTSAIAHSLATILNDPQLQQRMSQASLRIVATRDLSHTLTRLEQIYQKVLEQQSK